MHTIIKSNDDLKVTPRLARPTATARYLGISKSTLWHWLKTGQCPAPRRIGKRVTLFNLNEIDAWINTSNAINGGAK